MRWKLNLRAFIWALPSDSIETQVPIIAVTNKFRLHYTSLFLAHTKSLWAWVSLWDKGSQSFYKGPESQYFKHGEPRGKIE